MIFKILMIEILRVLATVHVRGSVLATRLRRGSQDNATAGDGSAVDAMRMTRHCVGYYLGPYYFE